MVGLRVLSSITYSSHLVVPCVFFSCQKPKNACMHMYASACTHLQIRLVAKSFKKLESQAVLLSGKAPQREGISSCLFDLVSVSGFEIETLGFKMVTFKLERFNTKVEMLKRPQNIPKKIFCSFWQFSGHVWKMLGKFVSIRLKN